MSKNKFCYLVLILTTPLLFFFCSNTIQKNTKSFENSCKCEYEDVDSNFEKVIQKEFYFCIEDITLQGIQLFEITMGKKNLEDKIFLIQDSDIIKYFKLEEGMKIEDIESQVFIDFSSKIGVTWNLKKFGLFYDYTCTLLNISNNVYTISLKNNYDIESTELFVFKELKINRDLEIEEIVFNTNGYGHEVKCMFNK